jgi:hypothetical protein
MRKEEVLHGVKSEKNILKIVKSMNADWICHISCRNCLLKHIIEWKIEGRIEAWRQGRRHKRLTVYVNEKRIHWKLKGKALDHTLLRTHFRRKRLWTCPKTEHKINLSKLYFWNYSLSLTGRISNLLFEMSLVVFSCVYMLRSKFIFNLHSLSKAFYALSIIEFHAKYVHTASICRYSLNLTEFNLIEITCILWIQKRLLPWIKKKPGKYNMHTVKAGTMQLIYISLSFSIYIKVFFYRVEKAIL